MMNREWEYIETGWKNGESRLGAFGKETEVQWCWNDAEKGQARIQKPIYIFFLTEFPVGFYGR